MHIGVWVTAWARKNLLENVLKLDSHVVYCDTDSIKLLEGYDKKVIEDYNNSVVEKLKIVAEKTDVDFERFQPKDVKGIKHLLGIFEHETTSKENQEFTYKEFITQRSKKICL